MDYLTVMGKFEIDQIDELSKEESIDLTKIKCSEKKLWVVDDCGQITFGDDPYTDHDIAFEDLNNLIKKIQSVSHKNVDVNGCVIIAGEEFEGVERILIESIEGKGKLNREVAHFF